MRPPVEGPVSHYLTPEAAGQIAREIAEAGGIEIFLIGRRGGDGLVHEVEAHAYGSSRSVPVLMNLVRPGEVIIHNHPSGGLTPSEADIDVSSIVGNMGVGSYIVDNACTRLRVVVRPHDPRKKQPLKTEAVEKLLGPASELARELGDYEDRPQQRRMAGAIAEAFNHDGIAAVEAGTGTGKSLAYLVPAVLYALENKERVVVATHTINLQEQVLHKDLPLVQRALGREFKAELVKGRSNYVCMRKAQYAREEMAHPQQVLIADESVGALREVLEWARNSESGDRQELPVPPTEEVWERVSSEADNCLRLRCPFYESCFFYNSRRRAARADVLVVNHSLLLSDIAVRRESNNWSTAAVLPPYQHVILDEAHHLEEVATNHLAAQVSRLGLNRLFWRLLRLDGKAQKGVLRGVSDALEDLRGKGTVGTDLRAWRMLVTDVLPIAEMVRGEIDTLIEHFGYEFLEMARLQKPSRREEHRVRLTPGLTSQPAWSDECTSLLFSLAREIEVFVSKNRETLDALKELSEDDANAVLNVAMEWRALLDRLDLQRRHIHQFMKEDARICRWVEVTVDRRDRLQVRLCLAPISVAELLADSLHKRTKSEVLTSATLTVDGEFDFLFERVGIPRAARPAVSAAASPTPQVDEEAGEEAGEERQPPAARHVSSLLLDTPFDFERQVFFGVPTDIGDPRKDGFDERLGDFIVRAVSISGGRAFVLFTSYGQMRRVYDRCSPLIARLGIESLIQGQESRDRLLRRFREDESSVLFATSSFWEGVDVKGRALELLIIARLPFAVPSDPIQEAQFEYMEAQGRDPFMNLVVPRAVIRFKQGFGRLIRARTDRGAVLIADDRVVRMGYGRRFLRSLPQVNVRSVESGKLLEELSVFFRELSRVE